MGAIEWQKLKRKITVDAMIIAFFGMFTNVLVQFMDRIMLIRDITRSEPWEEIEKVTPNITQNTLDRHASSKRQYSPLTLNTTVAVKIKHTYTPIKQS